MYILKLKHHFDACHNLKHYVGACSNLHGHRWDVEVTIKVSSLTDDMVVDFKTLKGIINELDHNYLNNLLDFNPTAENISKYLSDKIKEETGLKNSVTLWESPEASITYTTEEL